MSDLNKAEEMMIMAAARRLMGGQVMGDPEDIAKLSSPEAQDRAMRDLVSMIEAEENISPEQIRRQAYLSNIYQPEGSNRPRMMADSTKTEFRRLMARKLNQIRNEFPPGAEREMSKDAVFDAMNRGLEQNPQASRKGRKRLKKDRKKFGPSALMGGPGYPSTLQKLVTERRAKGMLPHLILLSLLGIGGLGLAGAASSGDQA